MKITYSWGEESVDAAVIYFVHPLSNSEINSDIGPINTPNEDGSVILSFDREDRLLEIEVLGASAMLAPALLELAGVEQTTDVPPSFINELGEESKKELFNSFDSPPYRHATSNSGEMPLKKIHDAATNTVAVRLDHPLYDSKIVAEIGPISTPKNKGAITLESGKDDRFLQVIVQGANILLSEEMLNQAENLGDAAAH